MKNILISIIMVSMLTLVGCSKSDDVNKINDESVSAFMPISNNLEKSIEDTIKEIESVLKEKNYEYEVKISEDKATLLGNDISKLTEDDLHNLTRAIYDCFMDNGLCRKENSFKTITIEIQEKDSKDIIISTWKPGSKPVDSWVKK